MIRTRVTIEQFREFIDAYPRKLDRDTVRICEPQITLWHDLTLGEPCDEDSEVARCVHNWRVNGEEDHDSPGKFWEYYICTRDEKPGNRVWNITITEHDNKLKDGEAYDPA